jgi:phosphatidylglycerophosphate synthase
VIDRALRSIKTRTLGPLAHALRRVPPGAITGVGLAVGVAAAAAAAQGAFSLALGLWLANRVLDGLDGEVARAAVAGATRQSDRGGYLDLMADLTVYAAVTLGVAAGATGAFGGEPLAPAAATWALAALLLATYYVNLGSYTVLAALLEKRGRGAGPRGDSTSIVMPAGLIEGAETIVLFVVMLALPHLAPVWFAIGAFLVGVTALQRVVWSARTLGRRA